MENQIVEQRAAIHKLEDLVYRLMHKSRISQAMDQSLLETIKSRRPSVSSQQSTTESPRHECEKSSSP
jgi:uncharacterized coiled-coil protein SlyX